MNELDELTALRRNVPAMSDNARIAGRWRLDAEFRQPPRRQGRSTFRRVAVPVMVLAVITAGLTGYQLLGPSGTRPTASAAEALLAAADAIDPNQDPHPRPDQYVYRDVLHVISNGDQTHVQSWESADGTRPGEIRISGAMANTPPIGSPCEGGSLANVPETRTSDVTGNMTHPIPPYREGDSLANAPYLKLATLPTDPAALLGILEKDPQVGIELGQPQPGVTMTPGGNHVSREVAIWGLIRGIVDKAPGAQQAALFRAAARLPGLVRIDHATDAAGRSGVGVGMFDPRLGTIELLFDKTTHRFLGEPIADQNDPHALAFNDALQRTAAVDRIGQLP